MGEKKKKEESLKTLKKVIIVSACVLFVVLMVLSGMGSSWLVMFTAVKPGDSVVIDYTLFDAAGKPIVTTEKTIYDQAVAQSREIFGSGRLTLVANKTTDQPIYAVPVYPSSGASVKQLAIFSAEYDEISSGIVGMKTNEQKRISLSSGTPMTHEWSLEQLALGNISLSDISPGDNFYMGVSDNPDEAANSTSANTYLRIGEVANKSTDGVIVDFSYSMIDLRVISINKR